MCALAYIHAHNGNAFCSDLIKSIALGKKNLKA